MITTKRAIKEIEAMGFHAWHHDEENDIVKVSAEHGDGAADYWERSSLQTDDGISHKLDDWASKNGLYWEWENPGCIMAYPV